MWLPHTAAMSGVCPVWSASSQSAPASSKYATHSSCPASDAANSGVHPSLSCKTCSLLFYFGRDHCREPFHKGSIR
eukprot:8360097-Pyramimonas_sp.AAC.1